MDSDRIGIRQRLMLERMNRDGGGIYLPRWRLDYDTRKLLRSLERRGLVAQVEAYYDGERCTVWRVVTEEAK